MHASKEFPNQAHLALSLGMAAFIALFILAVGMGWYEHQLLLEPGTQKAESVERLSIVLLGALVLEGSISSCMRRIRYAVPFAGTLLAFTLFHAVPLYLGIALLLASMLSWIARVVR